MRSQIGAGVACDRLICVECNLIRVNKIWGESGLGHCLFCEGVSVFKGVSDKSVSKTCPSSQRACLCCVRLCVCSFCACESGERSGHNSGTRRGEGGLRGQQIETQQLSHFERSRARVCNLTQTRTHIHTYSQNRSPSRGPHRRRTRLSPSLHHR